MLRFRLEQILHRITLRKGKKGSLKRKLTNFWMNELLCWKLISTILIISISNYMVKIRLKWSKLVINIMLDKRLSIHGTIGCIFIDVRLKNCQDTGICQHKMWQYKGIWTVVFLTSLSRYIVGSISQNSRCKPKKYASSANSWKPFRNWKMFWRKVPGVWNHFHW